MLRREHKYRINLYSSNKVCDLLEICGSLGNWKDTVMFVDL